MKKDFATQFKQARKVGVPLLQVVTHDAKQTIMTVRDALGQKGSTTPLIRWDVCKGCVALTDAGSQQLSHISNGENPGEWSAVLAEVLRRAENFEKDVILFISNAQLFWQEPEIMQGIWNLREPNKNKGNMLLLMVAPGSTLPTILQQDVMTLEEPLPTREQLGTIVSKTFEFAKRNNPNVTPPTTEGLGLAVDSLIGLSSFPAEQSTALNLDTKENFLSVSGMWDRKRQTINQTPGLQWYDGDASLEDIGGLSAIKEFLMRIFDGAPELRPNLILRLDEIEKAFAGTGTDMSGVTTKLTGSMLSWMQDKRIEGLLEVGVPGVSKSQLIYAVARHFKIPCINFDLAKMENSLVGQSTANLATAQAAIDAISDGRVMMIATSNGIESLPPELRRRFNLGTFFFDAPTASERAAIWKIYIKKLALNSEQPLPADNGWTGAEIEECCKKAYRLRLSLVEASKYIVPVTVSAREKIRSLRVNSHEKYLSASTPGLYRYVENHATVEVEGRSFN